MSDHSHDDEETYDLDPRLHAQTLAAQRNQALDRAAMWEAIAMRERQVNKMLAQQVADLQGTSDKADEDKADG